MRCQSQELPEVVPLYVDRSLEGGVLGAGGEYSTVELLLLQLRTPFLFTVF
jgi:hypothetical protein